MKPNQCIQRRPKALGEQEIAMSIWTYRENELNEPAPSLYDTRVVACRYCESKVSCLESFKKSGNDWTHDGGTSAELMVCPVCGWWIVTRSTGFHHGPEGSISIRRASGTLKNLNLYDLSTPSEILRTYLLANYRGRFHIHPKKYEDIVGGVF